ncbi:ankyrin repeat domain-containing protein 45 isoform X2 [Nelusetta ayraudi]|uniref:ankyrin repeat domain-containing protein 45 isoform X2 n=1 Tax=Nelusetta ayraudi TaxID=303726 RepID=UPI003F6E6877
MQSTQKDIYEAVQSGELESIKELFGEVNATEGQKEMDLFSYKDGGGRNALMTACMLGRSDIVTELVNNGAQVNESTVRGYTSLHLAACWGHLDTVITLVGLGAAIQAETIWGEKPADLARKYCRTECADSLALAAAEQDLVAYVSFVKQLITDPDKHLTREEKSICTRLYSSKSDWLQNEENLTVADLKSQKKEMEVTLQPILKKLSLLG